MNTRVIFLILVLAFAGFKARDYFVNKKLQTELSKVQNTAQANILYGVPNSCNGKKYCITVFVAPWCPACKSGQGTFKMLNEYLPKNRSEIGFGMVVGAGSSAENKSEKEILAPIEVTLDETGQIFKNRKISSYPTWIVSDNTGKEIFKNAGTPVLNSQDQLPILLSEFLSL